MTCPKARTQITKLTARQRQVLRGIALSQTVRAIGENIGIAHQTVYFHRRKMNVLLGIEHGDTAALTRLAMRAGLVE